MSTESKPKSCLPILPNDEHRLIFILCLTLIYPLFCGCFFVLFLFIILPIVLTQGIQAPIVTIPGIWLHLYWLVAVSLWALVCVVFLPLMGPYEHGTEKQTVKKDSLTYRRESGVSVKEDKGCLYGIERDDGKHRSIGNVVLGSNTLDKDSSGSKDSVDKIKSGNDYSNDQSIESLYGSLNKRKSLAQSGELLTDCMKKFNSDDNVNGEIIRGNTNCVVHARDNSDGETDEEYEGAPVRDSVGEQKACEEPLLELLDRSKDLQVESTYAEVDTINDQQQPTQMDQQKEPDESKEELQEESKEAVHEESKEAVQEESKEVQEEVKEEVHEESKEAVQEESKEVQEETKEEVHEESKEVQEESKEVQEETLAELPQSRLREKSKALPNIDTKRASQADSYAPSTLSPRESNVVFLYVNSDCDG